MEPYIQPDPIASGVRQSPRACEILQEGSYSHSSVDCLVEEPYIQPDSIAWGVWEPPRACEMREGSYSHSPVACLMEEPYIQPASGAWRSPRAYVMQADPASARHDCPLILAPVK